MRAHFFMRYFRFRILPAALLCVALAFPSATVHADDIPFALRQAVPLVHCGNRQGSGVVINAAEGYVLTNAHVLLNQITQKPDPCEVGFLKDPSNLKPTIYYEADWDRYVYDENHNQDFAILRLGAPEQRETLASFPSLKSDEFSKVGDAITVVGFPNTAKGKQAVTSGVIQGLEQGIIKTNAVISPGASGGAGIDAHNNLIGVATRILFTELSNGTEQVVDYELVDIRAILQWLDTYSTNSHDKFFTHASPVRFHGPQVFITQGNLNCTLLAKSPLNSTVYCLHANGTRTVFPNDTTYHSWLADFSGVITVPIEQLAAYQLSNNVTLKPGTLIKVETDPNVYVVSDAFGTIRWIPSEARASELYGDGWAGFVKDVPVGFFTNYHRGPDIE